MTDFERRTEDRRIGELVHAVSDLTAQVKALQEKYENLIPEVRLVQTEARLEKRLVQLETVIEGLAKSLTSDVKNLTEQVGQGMKRLNDINEEMMRQQARQVDEKHQKEMEMAQQQIADLKAAAKNRSIDAWTDRWGKFLLTLTAVAGVVWAVFKYFVIAAQH